MKRGMPVALNVTSLVQPKDMHALVAIDLGAGSYRVSLLCWIEGGPHIQLVYWFSNHVPERADGLRWNIDQILAALEGSSATEDCPVSVWAARLRPCMQQRPQGVVAESLHIPLGCHRR
jgi:hypothetical protein